MPVDWKSPESFNRLLAATVASMDGQMKLNYKRIADFYGEGATYDAIEGRFRIIKKQAAKLKEEVESGRPIAPARGSGGGGSTDTTPRKPRAQKSQQNSQDGVITGRITKPTSTSPTKKRPSAQVKRELLESSTSASSASTDVETPASSIDHAHSLDDSFGYDPTLASFEMSLQAVPDPHDLTMIFDSGYLDNEPCF